MSESAPQPEHAVLSAELSRMVAEDQEARQRFVDDEGTRDAFTEIDRRNTVRMKQIVDEIGWPTISNIGKDGSFNAWLLVQHADGEAEFQANCLKLMQACPPEEVEQRLVGYLDDRVRVAAGQPQLYGTQFEEGADGKPKPSPIEDPENLDERRAAIGLEPFEEYRRQMEGS